MTSIIAQFQKMYNRGMEDRPDMPVTLSDLSYLREIAVESHEAYQELRAAGFTEHQAVLITGQMFVDAVNSRDEHDSVFEFMDEEDDDDDDGDSGF